jgi:hypothetical protein
MRTEMEKRPRALAKAWFVKAVARATSRGDFGAGLGFVKSRKYDSVEGRAVDGTALLGHLLSERGLHLTLQLV